MKRNLVYSLLALTCLTVCGARPHSAPPASSTGLVTSVNLNLKVTETGEESVRGPASNATIQAKLVTSRVTTKDLIRTLNDRHALVPDIAGWKLVGVIPDAQEISASYRFYLVKEGETPVLIDADKLSLTIDAAALAYREQSVNGAPSSGGGKFDYAVTFVAGDITAHGTASGVYHVRNVTVDGAASTLVVPSAITFRLTGAQDKGETAGIVEGSMVFTAHKAVDVSTYPVPAPAPEPVPEPEPTPEPAPAPVN